MIRSAIDIPLKISKIDPITKDKNAASSSFPFKLISGILDFRDSRANKIPETKTRITRKIW